MKTMVDMTEIANMAVEMGEAFGYQLDYTKESIPSLEELAEMCYAENMEQAYTEVALNRAAAMLGAYLGETMLRNGLKDQGFA